MSLYVKLVGAVVAAFWTLFGEKEESSGHEQQKLRVVLVDMRGDKEGGQIGRLRLSIFLFLLFCFGVKWFGNERYMKYVMAEKHGEISFEEAHLLSLYFWCSKFGEGNT